MILMTTKTLKQMILLIFKYLVYEEELQDLLAKVRCKECNKILLLPKRTESLGSEEASALKIKVQYINVH